MADIRNETKLDIEVELMLAKKRIRKAKINGNRKGDIDILETIILRIERKIKKLK